MPQGFTEPGKVLKLNRSLYRLKQAPRNLFSYLKSKLESVGFRSAEIIDPCLFVSDNVICLVYVDDTLFFSPREDVIDEIITKLHAAEMDLEVEGSVAGFLGVHIARDSDNGSIELTQMG
jgi:Reverse transcriptase (RNA-dependent DNA polymerase)